MCFKASSWSDGDIGQLQTMLFEAQEALDEVEQIIYNKYSAVATVTQQPCDLAAAFHILIQIHKKVPEKDDIACCLAQDIDEPFAVHLRIKGLNLDSNPGEKKSLVTFCFAFRNCWNQQ